MARPRIRPQRAPKFDHPDLQGYNFGRRLPRFMRPPNKPTPKVKSQYARERFFDYLMAMALSEREDFADGLNSSLEYLKQIGTGIRDPSIELAVRIEKATRGACSCEYLRPDLVDVWRYLRGRGSKPPRQPKPPARKTRKPRKSPASIPSIPDTESAPEAP
jgi:DNA-binding transcriptional regulator YdaS (Cro superfamily)